MAVPLFLRSLEETSFSTWLRESNSLFAFYFVLLFHTFGLALLVGANAIVDLRILGVAANLPLAPLKRFFSIMWLGFTLNVITGILLVIAYPTKALTNPGLLSKADVHRARRDRDAENLHAAFLATPV